MACLTIFKYIIVDATDSDDLDLHKESAAAIQSPVYL